MILNPNETMVLVVCRSKAVNPPYSDLDLSGVSIYVSTIIDIHGVKFDSKLTVGDNETGIVSRASERILF